MGGKLELEKQKVIAKLERPRLYQVVLLNDDFTPMDFVVDLLMRFFHIDEARANTIMLEVHQRGRAVCGVFTRDLAETKVQQVNDYARYNEYPLLSLMEQI